MSNEELSFLIAESVRVILEFQQATGAYPASPNFPPYNYSWFRDGSFIADGMSRAGQVESAERFFDWGSQIIVNRRDHILSGAELEARYTYDGKESTEDWATFQLDGFGTWLWALKEHSTRHGRDIAAYQEAAGLVQHYLATKWQKPCIDWWEEREGIHAASLACVYAGLNAFDHPEASKVKAAINLGAERTDASLLACALFDAIDEEGFDEALKRIENELVSPGGGVHRFTDDEYYGGGEWPLLVCMLGIYYMKIGRADDANLKLDWVKVHIRDNGWLPEQVQDNLLHPDKYDEWVARAGNPANPLLWSHGMFLTFISLCVAKT